MSLGINHKVDILITGGLMDTRKELRENVRLLGELLGRVLVKQGGDSLLSTVEEIRALAKSARHDDADAWGTLAKQLTTLNGW